MSATANTSANIAVCALGLLLALAIEPAHAQRTSAYHFLATTESYEPLAEATAVLEPDIDDSLSPAINIGFAFTFAGREYTQFQISSNGFVRLGADGTAPSFNNNLASTTLGPLLAPLWDDLKTGSDGEVRYALSGMAPNRILTVEFASMHWDLHSDSANANFQVKLHETTHEIAFVYGEMGPVNNTSGGSSIGLSNGQEGTADFLSVTPGDPPTSSGMVANNVIGSSEFLAEGTIYRFSTPLFANDMQVLSLDTPAPTENARMFVPFTPEVTFRNVGSVEQTDVPVVYEVLSKVQPIYQSTKTIASIVPGESVQITFDQVSGLRPGVYRILARVQLSADENKDNDLLMTILRAVLVYDLSSGARWSRHSWPHTRPIEPPHGLVGSILPPDWIPP